MKRFADDEAVKTEILQLNEDCHVILGNIHNVAERLTELSRYYRSQVSNYNSYLNSSRMKNAGSDLTILSRRLMNATADLKLLAALKFPPIEVSLEEQEAEREAQRKQFTNKIDKNVIVKRKIDEEDGEEEEEKPARNPGR